MHALILSAILSLLPSPNPTWGETRAQYIERMEMIATVIEISSHDDYQLAMAVVVVFNGEGTSPEVHAGIKRGDHGRAICLGNNHQNKLTKEQWESLAGIDQGATLRCAIVTAHRLEKDLEYCRSFGNNALTYANAMVLYGTGRTCDSIGLSDKVLAMFTERAQQWKSLVCRKRLRKFLPLSKRLKKSLKESIDQCWPEELESSQNFSILSPSSSMS